MSNIVSPLASRIVPLGDFFEPVSVEELAAAEKRLDVQLPELWREILTTYGGFIFDGEGGVEGEGGQSFAIFTFFGFHGNARNILTDFEDHPDYKVNGVFPIADDVFGNRYVWDSNNDNVLFIDYDAHKPAVRVARTFQEFLARIDVTPDE